MADGAHEGAGRPAWSTALYGNTDANRLSVNVFTTAEQDIRGTAVLGTTAWTHPHRQL